MTKKNYETPSLELMLLLETCNVICSSGEKDYDVYVDGGITDLGESDWSSQGKWE